MADVTLAQVFAVTPQSLLDKIKTVDGTGSGLDAELLGGVSATTWQDALNGKASSLNATLTGIPTAPTAAVNTNTTQIATTAFTVAEIGNRAPTKTGTGASGTWGIDITGVAGASKTMTAASNLNVAAVTYSNFDGSNLVGAPATGWFNYMSTTHKGGNYVSAALAMGHAGINEFYVGVANGPSGTYTERAWTWKKIWHEGSFDPTAKADAVSTWVLKTTIPNAANLNTYTTTGLYTQRLNSQAAAGTNYPVANAGLLTVVADDQMVYQTYQSYAASRRWTRSCYSGTWSNWAEEFNTANFDPSAKVNTSALGVANGVATLGSDGKLLASQVPAGVGGGGSYVDLSSAQTVAGVKTFSDVPRIEKPSYPGLVFYSSGNGVDQKRASIVVDVNGDLVLGTQNDAGSATQANARLLRDGSFTIGGNTAWHAGNFNPANYASSSHSHDSTYVKITQVSNIVDPNTLGGTLSQGVVTTPAGNGPSAYTTIWNLGSNANRDGQFGWYYGPGVSTLWFRSRHDNTGNWNGWEKVATAGATMTWTGVHDFQAGTKMVVQNQQDGGTGRGIYMWSSNDSNWVMYMGQAGAGKSANGSTACTALTGSASHHWRFRVNNHDAGGFIWENNSEQCLMSLSGASGFLSIKGSIGVGGVAAQSSDACKVAVNSGSLGQQTGHLGMFQSGVRIYQIGIETDRSWKLWSYNDSGGYFNNPVTVFRDAQPLVGGSQGWSINGGTIWHSGNRGGLASSAYTVSDWNNADGNGWHMAAGAANSPGGSGWYIGWTMNHNSSWITQEVFDFTAGASPIRYRRAKLNGVWSAWTADQTFGVVAAQRLYSGYDSGVDGSVSASAWFRSNNQTGWYNASYGVGIWATDSTYVRSYNAPGGFAAPDFVISSDVRYKTGIRPLDWRGRLDPKLYTVIKTGRAEMGFIAQDVLKQYPEVVGQLWDEDAGELRYQLSYPRMTAILSLQINRLEDAHETTVQRVVELETEVAAVREENAALRTELDILKEQMAAVMARIGLTSN